ncbi:MAG: calcium-binding protein, partial [Hyphomonadaceae bacterium]|nr:calcium-binding protein [Hyphomonadaceae bacterium]
MEQFITNPTLLTSRGDTINFQGQTNFWAGAGDDTFNDNRGVQGALFGEAGDDVFRLYVNDGRFGRTLYGGQGIDTADFSEASNGITIDDPGDPYGQVSSTGVAKAVVFEEIENVIGSTFGDVIRWDGANNLLRGGDGDDELNGRGGDDTLEGGRDNDALIGGDGFDTASYAYATGPVAVSLAVTTAQTVATGDVDTLTEIEALIGASSNDTLSGNGGANRLSGAGGDDQLNGSGGDDILIGGSGADALDGGAGFDTASYATAAAGVTVNLGALAQNTGEAAGDSFTSIEAVEGSTLGDSLLGDGGGNVLRGLGGADFITGGGGDDTLIGDAGADALTGGDGNDVLQGGDANDYLDGGGGIDTLMGGAGDDTYVISDTSDELQEQAGGGVDNLYSYLSATLGANFENLVLLG